MISEQDLHEAIAECQGEKNPNANTCIKLAAYYTILNQMIENQRGPIYFGYSRSDGRDVSTRVTINSDSEFALLVNGKNQDEVWPTIDELMKTLQVMNPRLYDAVIKKLQ